ncbi:hypothetical protein F4780DRAFT_777949 [Xylariomycetidae sp. FL0641]|nr:hypothetical protein F4780DRAFT_777949 [Xylariomycetidae sp. FL0641]
MPAARSPANGGSPSKVRLNQGLFRNGVWHCNCQPRLPAVLLTVKRDTPNRGRTFFTCQNDRGKKNKCDFFLWSEDAHLRKEGAVLSNSRSEGAQTPSRARKPTKQTTLHESITPRSEKRHWQERTPITAMADVDAAKSTANTSRTSTMRASEGSARPSGLNEEDISTEEEDEGDEAARPAAAAAAAKINQPTALSTAAVSAGLNSKRKRPADDEFSDLSSGEEEQLAAMADSSQSASGSQDKHRDALHLSTPATSGGRSTAAASASNNDGLPTPLTEKPTRRVLFAEQQQQQPEGEAKTPTAKRQRTEGGYASLPPTTSAQRVPPTPASGADPATLTQDVMGLLRGQKLDEGVLGDVRRVLDRHAARAKGLEKGRDASRDAVRKADERIAQLQRRVADLENERRLDREARVRQRDRIRDLYRDS